MTEREESNLHRGKEGKMKNIIIRLFGLKGSFKWACKQMANGKIVKPKNATGTVKYCFDKENQKRLLWTFDRYFYQWSNANFFYSDMMSIDWVLVEEEKSPVDLNGSGRCG